jgi:hypothetical protein
MSILRRTIRSGMALPAVPLVVIFLSLIVSSPALAALQPIQPLSTTATNALVPLDRVPLVQAPAVDRVALAREDLEREAAGLPYRFAIPNAVSITPDSFGIWEDAGSGMLVWRLRVRSEGAGSLNLGFTRYLMPDGGRLYLYAPGMSAWLRGFSAEDNADHGELWTPVLLSQETVVEVDIPAAARDRLELHLGSINAGYRGFGTGKDGQGFSGSCNVDVVCPVADPWRAEVPSVARITIGGFTLCTGFMVNNTANDQKPLFMTANHCGLNSSNAGSLVAYWNYETSSCGGVPDGSLADNQSGSSFKAAYSPSDFTLVQLSRSPDPAWKVTFAGWDRTGADAQSATCIHHPAGDEKRISFEYQATQTTSYLGSTSPGDGTHVRVVDWDDGTTEGGSSGSPLFDQNHHVIGQLHGGYAACGNNSSDWYGKFSVSWNGGGNSSTRLKDWLDPANTGAASLATLNPWFQCQTNADCDDGLFCNGSETCSTGSCAPGSNPCPGQGCDENTDTCYPVTCNNNARCDSGETCATCTSDCISGTAPTCGNDICETGGGENCLTCPADCNGVQTGKTQSRYCCGNGGVNPVGCGDSRCIAAGNSCSTGMGTQYCCGDSTCSGAETRNNCSVDCGACVPAGGACAANGDCCSGTCKSRVCR